MAINYNNTFLHKLGTAIFVLGPILSWYEISFPVPLGYTMILFVSFFALLKNNFNIRVLPKAFWIVFIYICFLWVFNNGFALWTLLPPGGWVFFIFALSLIGGVQAFDINTAIKYMKIIVWIAIVLFWIQLISLMITGTNNFCFVPHLTNHFSYGNLSYEEMTALHHSSKHPCSIFIEKSYMAYYLLAYLCFLFFEAHKEKWFDKESIALMVTLIALRSGSGMVGLVVLLVAKAFHLMWKGSLGRRIMMSIAMVPLSLAAFWVYQSTEVGQEMISRTSEFSTENSSGYTRVIAGYMTYDMLTTSEKIIGAPDAVERFGIERNDGGVASGLILYLNGIQSILVGAGLLGLLLYVLFYTSIYKMVSLGSRMQIILLLAMALLESNYLNPYMMLLTIIPCAEYYHRRIHAQDVYIPHNEIEV